MKKITLLIVAVVLLNGCATFHPSVPEGYTGPTAKINDTAKRIDSGKADFFYLSHIDGKKIEHSYRKSLIKSYGKGNSLSIVLLKNTVPAKKHTFTIIGTTVYAAPIRALIGTVYEVKGDVSFSPLPNEEYEIKGNLSEEKSAVWIERVSNGKVIQRIEVEGSSR